MLARRGNSLHGTGAIVTTSGGRAPGAIKRRDPIRREYRTRSTVSQAARSVHDRQIELRVRSGRPPVFRVDRRFLSGRVNQGSRLKNLQRLVGVRQASSQEWLGVSWALQAEP